ncbi:MAG: response regulator, partial [Nitrospiria bacterium]
MRALHIEDNPDDRALAARELIRAFPDIEIVSIGNHAALSREIEHGTVDLVLTDYQFNWSDGLQVLREVKARRPDCPVVMFTGSGDEELVVEALKAGLDDYVIKSPKHAARLATAVRSALERSASRRSLRRSEER